MRLARDEGWSLEVAATEAAGHATAIARSVSVRGGAKETDIEAFPVTEAARTRFLAIEQRQ